MLFTRRRKGIEIESLMLLGTEINVSRKVKYLGVTLDMKLTWNDHVETRVQKAKRILHQCKRVCGRKWGISPKAAHWIYTVVVRPTITYASVVWWPKASQATVRRKLDGVQRIACIGICGAIRTTPTQAMEAMLGLLPLDLFVRETAARSAIRMRSDDMWYRFGSVLGHRRILDLVDKEVRETQMPMERMSRVKVVERLHHTLIADGFMHDECMENDISIFTDGSFMDGRAGAGVYSSELNLSCTLNLGEYVSVYQAEMLGLLHALDHLLECRMYGKRILIALDNQSVIKRMQRIDVNSSLVLECVLKLNRCASTNEVTLMWVKGHVGIAGNEAADELAKKGSEAAFCGPEPRTALGNGLVRARIFQWVNSINLRRWMEGTTCRQARMVLREPLGRGAVKILGFNRSMMSWITALITGHGNFKYHLKRMQIVDDDICRMCLEDAETAAHVVCECPALASGRLRITGKHTLSVSAMGDLSLREMLAITKDCAMRIVDNHQSAV